MIGKEEKLVCPKCGSDDTHFGYGIAMGQPGTYSFCFPCGSTFDIKPDEEE